MEYFDNDGFVQLIKKSPKPKDEKPAPKKKIFKNPFKKGSWKSDFFKKFKRTRVSPHVEDFHFVKMENLLVYRKDDPKTLISKTRFNLKDLEKISKKYSDSFVLINAFNNTYIKLTLKSYLKLMKVKSIVIEYKVMVQEDGDDEICEYYEADQVISNINELMGFINYFRELINGVGEVQARVCCYTWVEFKVKTLVIKQDGSTKSFKGDFNEVMEYFDIKPLL